MTQIVNRKATHNMIKRYGCTRHKTQRYICHPCDQDSNENWLHKLAVHLSPPDSRCVVVALDHTRFARAATFVSAILCLL